MGPSTASSGRGRRAEPSSVRVPRALPARAPRLLSWASFRPDARAPIRPARRSRFGSRAPGSGGDRFMSKVVVDSPEAHAAGHSYYEDAMASFEETADILRMDPRVRME